MLLEGDSRDYDKMYTEREISSEGECKTLVDMCKNKYDLENKGNEINPNNREKQPVIQGAPYYRQNNQLYRTSIRKNPSIRDFHSQSYPYKRPKHKNLLDYLKEEARKERERLTLELYERNSYSPVYESDKEEIKEVRNRPRRHYNETDSEDFSTTRKQTSPSKRVKRSAQSSPKRVVPQDSLSNLSDNTNIESFADFSDSMFKSEMRNKTKVFLCPEPGCTTELPSLSRIKRHFLVHTNLKPFECLNPNCTKRFSRKDNMIQHYRTHCNTNR